MLLAKVKSLIWLIMKLPFFTGPLRCQDMWYSWDGWRGNSLWSKPQLLYHWRRRLTGCLYNCPRTRYLKLWKAISHDWLKSASCRKPKSCPAHTTGSEPPALPVTVRRRQNFVLQQGGPVVESTPCLHGIVCKKKPCEKPVRAVKTQCHLLRTWQHSGSVII